MAPTTTPGIDEDTMIVLGYALGVVALLVLIFIWVVVYCLCCRANNRYRYKSRSGRYMTPESHLSRQGELPDIPANIEVRVETGPPLPPGHPAENYQSVDNDGFDINDPIYSYCDFANPAPSYEAPVPRDSRAYEGLTKAKQESAISAEVHPAVKNQQMESLQVDLPRTANRMLSFSNGNYIDFLPIVETDEALTDQYDDNLVQVRRNSTVVTTSATLPQPTSRNPSDSTKLENINMQTLTPTTLPRPTSRRPSDSVDLQTSNIQTLISTTTPQPTSRRPSNSTELETTNIQTLISTTLPRPTSRRPLDSTGVETSNMQILTSTTVPRPTSRRPSDSTELQTSNMQILTSTTLPRPTSRRPSDSTEFETSNMQTLTSTTIPRPTSRRPSDSTDLETSNIPTLNSFSKIPAIQVMEPDENELDSLRIDVVSDEKAVDISELNAVNINEKSFGKTDVTASSLELSMDNNIYFEGSDVESEGGSINNTDSGIASSIQTDYENELCSGEFYENFKDANLSKMNLENKNNSIILSDSEIYVGRSMSKENQNSKLSLDSLADNAESATELNDTDNAPSLNMAETGNESDDEIYRNITPTPKPRHQRSASKGLLEDYENLELGQIERNTGSMPTPMPRQATKPPSYDQIVDYGQ